MFATLNQSSADLGIVEESRFQRFGISRDGYTRRPGAPFGPVPRCGSSATMGLQQKRIPHMAVTHPLDASPRLMVAAALASAVITANKSPPEGYGLQWTASTAVKMYNEVFRELEEHI